MMEGETEPIGPNEVSLIRALDSGDVSSAEVALKRGANANIKLYKHSRGWLLCGDARIQCTWEAKNGNLEGIWAPENGDTPLTALQKLGDMAPKGASSLLLMYGGDPLIRNDAGICAETILSHDVAGTQPTIGPTSLTTKGEEELVYNDENIGREIPLHHFQHPFREWADVLHEKEIDQSTGRYVGTPVESLVDHLGHHAAPFADEWAAASLGIHPKKLPSVVPSVKNSGDTKFDWHFSTPQVLLNSVSAALSVFNPRLQQLWIRLKLETSLNVIEIIQLNKSEYQWASFPVDTGSLPPNFRHSRQWYYSGNGALLIRGLKAALATEAQYCNDQVKFKFSGTEGKLLNVSLTCCPGDDPNLDHPNKYFVYSAVALEGSGMLPMLQMPRSHFEICSTTLKSILQDLLIDETTTENGGGGRYGEESNNNLTINVDTSLSSLRMCLTSTDESSSAGEATIYLPGKLMLQSPYTENNFTVYSFGSNGKYALKRFSWESLDDSVCVTCSHKYFTITAGASKRAIAPSASISILSGQ